MDRIHTALRCAAVVFSTFILTACGPSDSDSQQALIEQANAQVNRVATFLDERTTETGVYVRADEDDIQETDPWGSRLQVHYAQGGVAENVPVRSAGPDRQFDTDDDVVAQRMSTNLKGIGEGIKQNAEETAANAAKGAAKGALEGIKESVKSSLPGKKKRDSSEQPKVPVTPKVSG